MTTITLSSVPLPLKETLEEMAAAQGRSMSAQIVVLLKEIVAIKRTMQPLELIR